MASTTFSSSSSIMSATAATIRNQPRNKAVYIKGVNSYAGLKAHNTTVLGLGNPVCTEQCFATVVNSLRTRRGGGGGGAFSSTCNAAGEIFRIAAIMNGLVLVGVAVGFVLLRIEASLEEATE